MLVVIDTNVLVSGLINPDGPPARVVDLLLANVIQAAFDDRVLAEYDEVLTRKPFSLSTASTCSLFWTMSVSMERKYPHRLCRQVSIPTGRTFDLLRLP